MASSFPKYFLLKSTFNSKYVRHVNDLDGHKDFLLCDGEDISNLHSRFQVEQSTTIESYFHIRSCYTNKYWAVDSDGRIYAGEKEPVADTAFHMISPPDGGPFRLVSSKVNQDVSFDTIYYSSTDSKLVLATPKPFCAHEFIAIDWETLVVLPRYVAFKGDNGKYLQVSDYNMLQYKADKRNYKSATFEIFMTPDGTIRLKNDGKFWRAGPNWIYCDSESQDGDYSDPATRFMPVQVEKNVIALRSMNNNFFCRRTSFDYHSDSLRAEDAGITISREAHFQVEEPVASRKITGVKFRENDCRYYNDSIVTMASAFVSNNTKLGQQVSMDLTFTHASTHTWTTSYLSSFNIKTGFSFDIPSIIGITYESSTQTDNFYEWGQKREMVKTSSQTTSVPVKPGGKVKVKVSAMRRRCDVPFSYTRQDILDDGSLPIIEDKDDGVYTGIYCTEFNIAPEPAV